VTFQPHRFPVVHTAPVHQLMSERVLLYALICGLQPERALEIGTLYGGSTMIMAAAMDDIGKGRIACVDPQPRVAPEHWKLVEHRATMIAGLSPDVLAGAAEAVGGPFDFALIDGDHTKAGVIRDIDGVLNVLADEAWMLFHDAHYHDVREAIDERVTAHPDELHDAGILSTPAAPEHDDPTIRWGGFRLVRRAAVATAHPEPGTGGIARLVRRTGRMRGWSDAR
jgi:predicted O-methyltransferase YrrM